MCVSQSGCQGNEAALKTSGNPNTVGVEQRDESSNGTFCS